MTEKITAVMIRIKVVVCQCSDGEDTDDASTDDDGTSNVIGGKK